MNAPAVWSASTGLDRTATVTLVPEPSERPIADAGAVRCAVLRPVRNAPDAIAAVINYRKTAVRSCAVASTVALMERCASEADAVRRVKGEELAVVDTWVEVTDDLYGEDRGGGPRKLGH